MDKKTLSAIAVSLAVIVGSLAAIVVSINRTAAARAAAEYEAVAADRASAEAKKAKSDADAAEAKAREKEAEKLTAEDERTAQTLEKENLKSKAEIAAREAERSEAMAKYESAQTENFRLTNETACLIAETASNNRKAEEAKARTAQATAEAERARNECEKFAAEKIKAEAKVSELRKIDFEAWGNHLREKELDIEERERALQPEKTIADLAWAGGREDTVFDANGNVTNQVKTVYDPEKDWELPEASRKLAKTQRIVREEHDARAAETRDAILSSMEKLYVSALKDGRVIDADFYKKSILSMYPDWKFKGSKSEE